ncbi:hypothetical protein ACL6C3_08440 [Capilliphycus salinus ALCB114379]
MLHLQVEQEMLLIQGNRVEQGDQLWLAAPNQQQPQFKSKK